VKGFTTGGTPVGEKSSIFENTTVQLYSQEASWKVTLQFKGDAPEKLQGILYYTYGRNDEFYPSTAAEFTVSLPGGVAAATRIFIPTIDIDHPYDPSCGDDIKKDSSLFSIFLLGFLGGLIALITPCVFPMIPLTVSFFTKGAKHKKRGRRNAFIYGFFIFLIYVLLTIPFHIAGKTSPDIFNNISTNVWLNLVFFAIFIVFAISFFGYFEIALPSGIANKMGYSSWP
jgi:thiol:disulfide interchange protein